MTAQARTSVPARDGVVGALLALDDIVGKRLASAPRVPYGTLFERLRDDGVRPLLEDAGRRGLRGAALGLPDGLVRGTGHTSLEWLVDLLSDPHAASGPHAELVAALQRTEGVEEDLHQLHEWACSPDSGPYVPEEGVTDGHLLLPVVLPDVPPDRPATAWVARLVLEGTGDGAADGHDDTVRNLTAVKRGWKSVTPATNRASDGAVERVRSLLLRLGREEEPAGDRKPRLAAPGLLPPSTLDDTAVALPAALRLLSRTLDTAELPYPLPSTQAAGVSSASLGGPATQYRPMDPDEASLRAGACAGALVHPGQGGWFRTSSDGSGSTLVVSDPRLTLEGAARAYWGAAWDAWARDWHATALRESGWSLSDWTDDQPDRQPLPDVSTDQVDSLVAVFREPERKVAVLGGPSGSGKSCIARCTARALAGTGRQVVVLAPDDRSFPSGDTLAGVVRHALGSLEPPAHPEGGCPVVVLDGIRPMGETDVGTVLPAVSSELDVSLLACLEYDVNSSHDWQAAALTVVPSIVRPAALHHLAARAREIHGDKVAANERFVEALARRCHHDLRAFVKGLCAYRGGNDTVESLEEDLRNRFRSDAGLGAADQELAAVVAAVSLLGGDVPVRDEEARDLLVGLGAVPDKTLTRLRFPSPADCRTILDTYTDLRYGTEADRPGRRELVVGLVAGELFRDLGDPSSGLLPVLRGARLYDERVCRSIADRLLSPEHEDAFTAWRRNTPPVTIALLLLSVDSSLGEKVIGKLLETLVDRLPDTDVTHARDLLPVVRTIHRHRHRFADTHFDTLVDWLVRRFDALVESRPRAGDGLYSLLEQLSRFHDPRLDELVARRGARTLVRLDPDKALDYRTIGRVERLVRRAATDIGEPEYAFWVQNEDEVRKLLDHDPDPARGIALYLASLVLRLRYEPGYDDWELVFEEHEVRIRQALKRADAVDLRYALGEARDYQLGFVTKLLNTVDGFDTAIHNALRSATPTDAAQLLRTTSEIHGETARNALYGGDRGDRPDAALARALAQQVRSNQDAKGAGLLLSATARIDDLYLTEKKGFGQYLAEELGNEWVRTRLEEDPRISVQYHLIKGIWEANASFREECLELFVDAVARALNRSMRPWGPQAALLLGQDEELGAVFLDKLGRSVPDRRLFEGMKDASIADARRYFHQLGRAMYQSLPSRYVAEHDAAGFIERTASASPSSAALSAQETARTLIDGGVPPWDAGLQVLRKDDGETPEAVGERWAGQLGRGAGASQVTEVINVLARLNGDSASATLRYLQTRKVRRRKVMDSLLRDKVRQAVYSDPVEAARLLTAVERVSPGAGTGLMHDLQGVKGAWNAFTSELAHIQHPTQQYQVVRQLVALGLRPGGRHSQWVEKLRARHHAMLRQVTSPGAIGDVLRLALIWDPDWARQVADDIPGHRLARRLAYAQVKDLTHTPSLLSLLVTAEAGEPVQLLFDALERLEPASLVKRLNAHSTDVLLDVALRARPEFAHRLAPAVVGAVDAQIRRDVVFDEAEHWTEIGWTARSLHLMNRAGLLSRDVPRRRPNPSYVPAAVWGTMWLPRQEWTRGTLDAVAGRLLRPSVSGGRRVFVAYAYASREGRTGELRSSDGAWPLLERCNGRSLAALQRLAEQDPDLRAALLSQQDALLAQLAKPTAWTDGHAKDARAWFASHAPGAAAQLGA